MLTGRTSAISERKYSNLSETSFALCKSMLPWQMFSFNSGLLRVGVRHNVHQKCAGCFNIPSSLKMHWGLLDEVTSACKDKAIPLMWTSDLSLYIWVSRVHYLWKAIGAWKECVLHFCLKNATFTWNGSKCSSWIGLLKY